MTPPAYPALGDCRFGRSQNTKICFQSMERWTVLGTPGGSSIKSNLPSATTMRWFFMDLEAAWHRIALLYIRWFTLFCFVWLCLDSRCVALCIALLAWMFARCLKRFLVEFGRVWGTLEPPKRMYRRGEVFLFLKNQFFQTRFGFGMIFD